jgi:translation initiation factor IF-2
VPKNDGEALAAEIRCLHFEVSAKTGEGITELFERTAEESLKRLRTDLDSKKESEKATVVPIGASAENTTQKSCC